jgi:hypothetical protein
MRLAINLKKIDSCSENFEFNFPLIGPSQMCRHQINKNILLKQSSRLLVFIVDAPVSECRNTQFLSMQ